ncbi:MAG: hypothetical protein ED859_09250 [Desulfuromonadales bacterium]|nr:MAG: hypothetical protein ED859_09250 [Desulfuromonadales bacterium]
MDLQEVHHGKSQKARKTYYAQYYVGGRQKRVNLETTSLQIAKEKLRQLDAKSGVDWTPIPI